MSLPQSPQHTIHIELTATQAEDLANRITRALSQIREKQNEHPDMCYWDNTPLFGIAQGIELEILPDKRHKGCSGYCHY